MAVVAGSGEVRLGLVGHGAAWHGAARRSRCGSARPGRARRGARRCGQVWRLWRGEARPDQTWPGPAWQAGARRGGHGLARLGKPGREAVRFGPAGSGLARQGGARQARLGRHGGARLGKAGQAEGRMRMTMLSRYVTRKGMSASLLLPVDLSFEAWRDVGKDLSAEYAKAWTEKQLSQVQWLLGDWFNFGQSRGWPFPFKDPRPN